MDFQDALVDLKPDLADFEAELRNGLRRSPPIIPSKFFYDTRGSELFEEICRLPEYYPTRTEVRIMEAHGREIARCIGPRAQIVEYGSGSGIKTRLLLTMLEQPASYVPIEISKSALRGCYESLHETFPELSIVPVCADYTEPIQLPSVTDDHDRSVVFFPGSTIGNFKPDDAIVFLERTAAMVGRDGGLLIGVDLVKDVDVLEAAYNDAAGTTADFNLNMLARANRELDAGFDLDAFEHRAVYDTSHDRIEMHLVPDEDQVVELGGESIRVDGEETIITEYSYKYRVDDFQEMAAESGFEARKMWTDEDDLFSMWYLEVA